MASAISGGSGGGNSGGSPGTTIVDSSVSTVTSTVVSTFVSTVTATQLLTAIPSTFVTTIVDPSTTFISTASAVVTTILESQSTPQPTGGAGGVAPNSDAQNNQGNAVGYSSSGISPGAAAGIAIAGMVALLGICLLAYLMWRRIKKDRSTGPIPTPMPGPGTEVKSQPPMQQEYYPPSNMVAVGQGPTSQPRRTIHEVEG
jgi:hypothetical protein